jgi:hypothetical protein
MDYANTISGLLRKRDEAMGEMAELRERMAQVTHDVEAIDRVLDTLGYEGDLEGRTPRANRIILFYRNELRQWLLSELRKADGPLSSRDLAERICGAEGRDVRDKRMVCDVVKRVGKALRMLKAGKIVDGGKDAAGRYVWKLAP